MRSNYEYDKRSFVSFLRAHLRTGIFSYLHKDHFAVGRWTPFLSPIWKRSRGKLNFTWLTDKTNRPTWYVFYSCPLCAAHSGPDFFRIIHGKSLRTGKMDREAEQNVVELSTLVVNHVFPSVKETACSRGKLQIFQSLIEKQNKRILFFCSDVQDLERGWGLSLSLWGEQLVSRQRRKDSEFFTKEWAVAYTMIMRKSSKDT